MFAHETRRTVSLPRQPDPPAPRRFPVVATLAPILASAVLFAVTRSPYTLVFAMLGPVVAVGTTVDAAIHRRRSSRVETARFEAEFLEADEQVAAAHAAERDRLVDQLASIPASVVLLGSGDVPSSLRIEPMSGGDDRVQGLRSRAAVLRRAPITRDAAGGIMIVGKPVLAAAAARAIAIQLATRLPVDATRIDAPATPDWDWVVELPHETSRTAATGCVTFTFGKNVVRIGSVPDRVSLVGEFAVVVEMEPSGVARLDDVAFHPGLMGLESADRRARELRERKHPLRGAARMPDDLALARVEQPAAPGLGAVFGYGAGGPLAIDLVGDGPHAIVGGTTGSGKSELLVSWVLAMAAQRSPAQVSFLFVDFKGGAAFDPLLALPHSVGVITDLDAEQSLRALASLGAELRQRERELARQGLRSIDERAGNAPFARLVVVVDEYAALVETHSSLHGVFADIAARGRSLGVHLILCTQRPAGVVRDGILANCALRISLRVMAAADSTALLGTDAAAALPARPLGRALVSVSGSAPTSFQVARSDAGDVASVTQRWADSPAPRPPWLPPLARVIALDTFRMPADAASDDGLAAGEIAFGLEDIPEQQAQRPSRYRPRDQGSLLVVGGPRSGKSTLLGVLAAAPSELAVEWLPRSLPELWDALHAANSRSRAGLLLFDDLDAAIASLDESYRSTIVELLAALLRDGPAAGINLAITVQRVGGALQPLVALCGARLVLRTPDRQEHALAGGVPGEFSDSLPPGGGHWHGHRVQVFATDPVLPPMPPVRAVTVDATDAAVAVVSTRPEQFAERLRASAPGRRVLVLGPARFGSDTAVGSASEGLPDILVADPDSWQSQWSLLGALLRTTDVLFDGCSQAELRAITRSRELPPPFPSGERPLWLKPRDGELQRARLA